MHEQPPTTNDLPGQNPHALAVLSFFLLIRYRMNSVWLVLGGAIVGSGAAWLHH